MSGIVVRGERDGLILTLPTEGTNEAAIAALRAHLEGAGAFFEGATVTLDVGERSLDEAMLAGVRDLLAARSMTFQALRGSDETTRAAARSLGLALPFVAAPAAAPHATAPDVPEESVDALLVRRTLRSGQAVRHPGAVVVLGDVNPGAEVVAGGDVVVWGALRGLVHAGASGDDGAVVFALKLSATQLRIGHHIAMAPDDEERGSRLRFWKRLQQRPELARVQDGVIVVEAWAGWTERT